MDDPDHVLVWRDGFSDWKPAEDVPEFRGTRQRPPPLPRNDANRVGLTKPRATAKTRGPGLRHRRHRARGRLGDHAVFGRYLFVPAAFICAVIALAKRQAVWGIVAVLLSVVGLGEIIYTSQQITGIFTAKHGQISLPQPAFAPPPVVTQAQCDRIREGMTYDQVRDLIGTAGQELSRSNMAGYSTVVYSWTNTNGSNMNAMFQNDRLINKAQFGLR